MQNEDLLIRKIEAAMARRAAAGLAFPEGIGCSPRLADRMRGYAWRNEHFSKHPPTFKILPMLKTDTAFLLVEKKIVEIISTAEPEPDPRTETA